jgi:hypothetical protein
MASVIESELQQLRKESRRLKEENGTLKDNIKLLKLLAKIGAAVRNRFLVKSNGAKFRTLGDQWLYLPEASQSLIDAGNGAAHQGNMAADVVLFDQYIQALNTWPSSYENGTDSLRQSCSTLFSNLYCQSPEAAWKKRKTSNIYPQFMSIMATMLNSMKDLECTPTVSAAESRLYNLGSECMAYWDST